MSKKRVFIIHGWEGSPSSNWFPWMKQELENRRFEAIIPEMPNTNHPVFSEWLAHLKKIVGKADLDTYLVGHSLGVIAILKYLESFPPKQKIGGAVLVAGFPESIGYKELETFFANPLYYEKVKNSAKKFIAINSDDDPYVPLNNGEILKDKLGAELIIYPKGNHLNQAAGFTKLPVALESLLKML